MKPHIESINFHEDGTHMSDVEMSDIGVQPTEESRSLHQESFNSSWRTRPDTFFCSTVLGDDTRIVDLTHASRQLTSSLELTLSSSEKMEKERLFSEGDIINGRYRIEGILGQGGMGVVYQVSDLLGESCTLALKTFKGSDLSPEKLDLFRSEFKTMTSLSHPNVAKVFDFEPLRGTEDFLFTMEHVDGEDIFSSTRGNDWEAIVERLVQVCRALVYLHSRKVIHFDLKPENVLVQTDGIVKVLDFGIAGIKQLKGHTGTLGTPRYMAPEIAYDLGSVDHRYDLYSLGIMAYKLLVGKVPFEASSMVDLLRQHCFTQVTFDEDIQDLLPPWLRAVVEKLCSKDVGDRFQSANAVIKAINRDGGLCHEQETIKTRESYIRSSRFVGRSHVFERISQLTMERMKVSPTGAPPALLVAGESGVGKSRLMRELRYQVQLSKLPFIEGNCYQSDASDYGPVADVLDYLVPLAKAHGAGCLFEEFAQALTRINPSLAKEHRLETSLESGQTENALFGLLEQISELLFRISELTPIVLYFNDLQWARLGTMSIISGLVERVCEAEHSGKHIPITIIASYRHDEVEGTSVGHDLNNLVSTTQAELLVLDPLSKPSVEQMILSMLGIDEIPDEFIERVVEETGGNPFFVEEVMRALVEDGTVYLEDGSWAAGKEIGALDISSVDHVLQHRISMLGDLERDLLDVLSTIGQPASLEVLKEAVGYSSAEIQRALAVLIQRNLAIRSTDDDYLHQTSHDRVRQNVYSQLDAGARKKINGRIARSIERVSAGNLSPHLYQLAHHYRLSDNKEKALEFCLSGGRKAKERFSNELSIDLLLHAQGLLTSIHEKRFELEIEEDLGDLLYLTTDLDESMERFERVLAETKPPLDRARLFRKIGEVHGLRGDLSKASESLWKCVELLGERRPAKGHVFELATLRVVLHHLLEGSPRRVPKAALSGRERAVTLELVQAYLKLHLISFYLEPKEMIYPIIRASNLVSRLGECKEMVVSYGFLSRFLGVVGFSRRAQAFARKAEEVAERVHIPWYSVYAKSSWGFIHCYSGEWQRSLKIANEIYEQFRLHGDLFEIALNEANRSIASIFLGRLGAAAECTKQTKLLAKRANRSQAHQVTVGCLGWVEGLLGDLNSASSRLESVTETARSRGDSQLFCTLSDHYGEVLLAHGCLDRAIEVLEASKEVNRKNRMLQNYVKGNDSYLARAYLWKLREGVTRRERRRLLHLAASCVRAALVVCARRPNWRALCLYVDAMYRWERNNRRLSRWLFERSREVARHQGARLFLADAHYEEGRYLIDDDSRSRAGHSHLERSLEIYRECGVAPCVRRIEALLDGR